jgi:hypothetical protein
MLIQMAVPECPDSGCLINLNDRCPDELHTDKDRAYHSVCEAFGCPKYCCNRKNLYSPAINQCVYISLQFLSLSLLYVSQFLKST